MSYLSEVIEEDNKIRKIYNDYNEKAIIGVKNNNIKYFLEYTKISFEGNKMIIEQFGKITEFDLEKFPRIYTKRLRHRYNCIFFQQNQKNISIIIDLSYYKLQDVLDNLNIVDLNSLPENSILLSASEKENLLEKYIKEKNGKKIFEINNKNIVIHLVKASPANLVILWITFFFIFGIGIYSCIYMKEVITIKEMLIFIVPDIILLSSVLFGIIYENIKNKLKISFKEDGIMNVNFKKFNYKKNTVKLKFHRKIQHEPFRWINDDKNEMLLNDYIIEIEDNTGQYVRFALGRSEISQIKSLIENIQLM